MRAWPVITDHRLLARLAYDSHEFAEFLEALATGIPARAYDPSMLVRALAYPWERPTGSYLLRAGEVFELDALGSAERADVLERYTRDRHPIVAIGSNGSPFSLKTKFGPLAEAEDRDVLVLTGRLHDLDVGVIPVVTVYGAMPAALFESPGTAVRVSVVWLTSTQLERLTWAEIGYRLGRIEQTRFEVDGDDIEIESVFAYVARLGAYCPEPEATPVALAGVPATGRTAPALTQEQLLDRIAPLLLGDGARAEDVVRAACSDRATLGASARAILWPQARQLPDTRVTLLPVGAVPPCSPEDAARATAELIRSMMRA